MDVYELVESRQSVLFIVELDNDYVVHIFLHNILGLRRITPAKGARPCIKADKLGQC